MYWAEAIPDIASSLGKPVLESGLMIVQVILPCAGRTISGQVFTVPEGANRALD